MNPRRQAFLVLRAQAGDRDALDELLRSVQDRLYRTARSIVGQRELAEDVLQDVFVIVCRKLAWLREPDHFLSWTLRITSREAVRRLRFERGREATVEPDVIDRLPVENESDPLRHVLGARLLDLVSRAPPASRAVLALHYGEDLSLPEVASVLGVPIGTAKSRLSYGLGFLRRQLEADDSGPEPVHDFDTNGANDDS